MLYRVRVDMSKALSEMANLDIKSHHKPKVTIFVEANSPDGACANGIQKICSDILVERKTTRIREFVEELPMLISVKYVRTQKKKK